eukprot:303755-Prorocentrum_minimum.AAC.1
MGGGAEVRGLLIRLRLRPLLLLGGATQPAVSQKLTRISARISQGGVRCAVTLTNRAYVRTARDTAVTARRPVRRRVTRGKFIWGRAEWGGHADAAQSDVASLMTYAMKGDPSPQV